MPAPGFSLAFVFLTVFMFVPSLLAELAEEIAVGGVVDKLAILVPALWEAIATDCRGHVNLSSCLSGASAHRLLHVWRDQ